MRRRQFLASSALGCALLITAPGVLAQGVDLSNIDLTTALPDQIVLGNPNGDIEIHEFSDYFCPACQRMTADFSQLLTEDGNIRMVLHYYPNHGERSYTFSNLGAAAYAVDPTKFYELHTWMMAQRGRLNVDQVLARMDMLGYDLEAIERERGNPTLDSMYTMNLAVAAQIGVRGTPSFVFEQQVVGGYPGNQAIVDWLARVRAGRAGS